MAALRKSRRGSRKASRKASRRGRRRQKAGGTVTIYFMLIGGAVSNVFTSDPGFTVEGTTTPGQVKLKGTSPTAKVLGITVNALGGPAWAPASTNGSAGSMNTVVSGTTKFYAARGASTMGVMRPTGVAITGPGLSAATDNVTLYNLLSNSSWKIGTTSTTGVSTSGAIPPGGTAAANMRVILNVNP